MSNLFCKDWLCYTQVAATAGAPDLSVCFVLKGFSQWQVTYAAVTVSSLFAFGQTVLCQTPELCPEHSRQTVCSTWICWNARVLCRSSNAIQVNSQENFGTVESPFLLIRNQPVWIRPRKCQNCGQEPEDLNPERRWYPQNGASEGIHFLWSRPPSTNCRFIPAKNT